MTTSTVLPSGERRTEPYAALPWSIVVLPLLTPGCTPRVDLSADKPITINLNVKIDHEVRVQVQKDLERVLADDSGLF